MRAKLTHRAPLLSKLIGLVAALILLTLLPFSMLQIVEMLTHAESASRM